MKSLKLSVSTKKEKDTFIKADFITVKFVAQDLVSILQFCSMVNVYLRMQKYMVKNANKIFNVNTITECVMMIGVIASLEKPSTHGPNIASLLHKLLDIQHVLEPPAQFNQQRHISGDSVNRTGSAKVENAAYLQLARIVHHIRNNIYMTTLQSFLFKNCICQVVS